MPCCQSLKSESWGADLSEFNGHEILNSNAFKVMRKLMLEGKRISSCESCYTLEEGGRSSLRQISNQYFGKDLKLKLESTSMDGTIEDPKILSLMIKPGNVCNLKCRTCNPTSSSSWFEDSVKMSAIEFSPDKKVKKISSKIFDELVPILKDLKKIYFGGGEPLLHEEFYQILNLLIKENNIEFISLNTNLTVLRYKKFNVLKYFQEILSKKIVLDVQVSLDAIGEVGEYIRSGLDYNVLFKNIQMLQTFCSDANLSIGVTLSTLNVGLIPEMIRELCLAEKKIVNLDQIHIDFVFDPIFYCVRILNAKERADLENYYKVFLKDIQGSISDLDFMRFSKLLTSLLLFLKSTSVVKDPSLRKKFLEITRELDIIRGEAHGLFFKYDLENDYISYN